MGSSQYLILLLMVINYASSNKANLETIIGIDIGNTFSSVGIYRNGKIEIIYNDFGSTVTPSIVSFHKDGNISVGKDAQGQISSNSVFDLKYLLGQSFATVTADSRNWPFRIVNRNYQPSIEIATNAGVQTVSPVNVTSFLVKHLKNMTESFLGYRVHKCIITHPAYFDNNQRLAIKEAAKLAGLEVVRMMKDSVASAKTFRLDKGGNNRNILVYHLGGSTSDVSLLNFEHGVFEVLANRANVNLGGRSFNERVVNYLTRKYEAKTNQVLDKETIKTLQQDVEDAKIALSTQNQVSIELNGKVEIFTRKKFEELNMDLIELTLKSVSQVLEDSFLNATDVQDIVLIGGSTKIPKVRELVRNLFNGKEPVIGVEPNLAVVTGAVMMAGGIQGPQKTTFESTVAWIVSKLFWTGHPQHDELK